MQELRFIFQCTIDHNRTKDSTIDYIIKLSLIDDTLYAEIGGKNKTIQATDIESLIDNLEKHFRSQHDVVDINVFEAREVDDIRAFIRRIREL